METIKIKYHTDIKELQLIDGKSDWIDLRSAENIDLKHGEFAMISLGVSMKLPEGYEAHVAPRSSTYLRYGIIMTNSIGIIDNSYSGDNDIWMFPALCLWKDGCQIHKGDRIAQFRIVKKQPEILFETVQTLDGVDRGGFGSTGVK